MEWFRWFEGATSDPKFMVVARRTGQPVAFVIAVWAMLLERASAATQRGNIDGFDCESADALLGMPDGAACAIVEAMQAKGLIDGEQVCKLDERQPSREKNPEEPGSSTQRSREWRQRKKQQETDCNGMQQPATDCNGPQRHATDCNGLEEIREDKNKNKIKNILKPSIHTENEDPAHDTRSEQVGFGEKVFADEPSAEFQELRAWYSAHCRPEGIMAGFIEFKQAKSACTWPGQTRIYDDLSARSESSKWKRGFAPSLANYLRTRGWEAPTEQDNARASPAAKASQGSLTERNSATVRQVLAEMEVEHGN